MTNRAPIPIGLGLGALVVLAAPTLAALPTVEFDTPAQANGDLHLGDLQWALLVFHESSGAQFNMELQPESTTNHSVAVTRPYRPGTISGRLPIPIDTPPESMEGDFHAKITFRKAWSSLYIEAASIQIKAPGTEALLGIPDGQTPFGEHLPEGHIPFGAYRTKTTPPGLFWAIDSPEPSSNFEMSMQAEEIHRLEWHNATLDCSAAPCLDGARDQGGSTPIPGGSIGSRIMSYREVTSSMGSIQGNGTPWSVLVGGSRIMSEIDGWLRMPNAHVEGRCGETTCADPAGRTLQVQGNIILQDMAALDGQRVTSQFATSEAIARIDESPTFRLQADAAAWAVAAASGAGLLWFLWKPLAGLFARKTRPLLANPRAKVIHDVVHATPGISFNALRNTVGMAHGTVQYHLKRLLAEGLIVAYTYGRRVRYYENHGRHAQDWQERAALQKPELRRLHEWLARHPAVNQASVLQATAEWGWKRSTAQKYLKLLQGAKLLAVERTWEAVAYTAIRPGLAASA